MAWNPSPKVADCREIARRWGYDQIVVLAINSRTRVVETVSYGQTVALCNAARRLNEQIQHLIRLGILTNDLPDDTP